METVKGLTYIENYISKENAEQLINYIDSQEWNNELARRTQHYGYKYNYKNGNIKEKTKEIPDVFKFLFDKLDFKVDQIIVNEYKIGQGISPHTDHTKLFGDKIASLSLLEPTIMTFSMNEKTYEQFLNTNSLIILQDEARYKWKHEISKNKTFIYNDKKYYKNRRVSITMRSMN